MYEKTEESSASSSQCVTRFCSRFSLRTTWSEFDNSRDFHSKLTLGFSISDSWEFIMTIMDGKKKGLLMAKKAMIVKRFNVTECWYDSNQTGKLGVYGA